MKRKLLSLILVVAMLASVAVFTPAASAAESKATLAFGNAAGAAGDEVTVDFEITTEAFAGLQFMFEYDASRLTFDSIDWAPADEAFGAGFPSDLTNGDNKVFTSVGPYKILSWATGIGVGAVDLSEGVVMATLNFTINEDAPAGDAYVKFAPLGEGAYQPNKLETGAYSMLMDEMTFVDGTVTVVAEGQVAGIEIDDSDWDFADGVISGCLNESLATYTGAFVFPSEINGEAVTTIAARAFEEYAWSTIVIPASITLVEEGAIHTCQNLTKVYVLGAETELEPMSIGWDVTYNNKGVVNAKKTFVTVNDDDEPITTFYGAEGSTAQIYAETGDESDYFFPFVGADMYTVTVGDKTIVAPAETVAPGSAVIDGKTVIAWKAGDVTYAPGAAMTLTEDVALEPVTITAPVTSTEADFKLAANEADLAMRFTATLSKADYAALAELGDVTLGMLITPAAYVAKAGSFTKAALDTIGAANGAYVDIAIDGYYKETADDYILAGSLKGFSAKTLAKNPDFASVVYATVETAEGDVFTVYGDFNFDANQNVKTVAEAIVGTNITDTQKGWLNTLIGKFGA